MKSKHYLISKQSLTVDTRSIYRI